MNNDELLKELSHSNLPDMNFQAYKQIKALIQNKSAKVARKRFEKRSEEIKKTLENLGKALRERGTEIINELEGGIK